MVHKAMGVRRHKRKQDSGRSAQRERARHWKKSLINTHRNKQKRTAHRVYKSKKYMLFASSTVHRIAAENVICNDNHSVSDSEIEWGKIKKKEKHHKSGSGGKNEKEKTNKTIFILSALVCPSNSLC